MIPRNLTDKSREQFSWYFKILKALKCNEKTKFNKWKHSIPTLRVRSACWSGSSLSRALDPPSRARVLLVDHRSTGTHAHVTGASCHTYTRVNNFCKDTETLGTSRLLSFPRGNATCCLNMGLVVIIETFCLLTMIWGKKCLKCEIVSRGKIIFNNVACIYLKFYNILYCYKSK